MCSFFFFSCSFVCLLVCSSMPPYSTLKREEENKEKKKSKLRKTSGVHGSNLTKRTVGTVVIITVICLVHFQLVLSCSYSSPLPFSKSSSSFSLPLFFFSSAVVAFFSYAVRSEQLSTVSAVTAVTTPTGTTRRKKEGVAKGTLRYYPY